jgi:hypothetical protein
VDSVADEPLLAPGVNRVALTHGLAHDLAQHEDRALLTLVVVAQPAASRPIRPNPVEHPRFRVLLNNNGLPKSLSAQREH